MIKIMARVMVVLFVIAVIGAIGMAFLQVYVRFKGAEQDAIAQTYIKDVVWSFNTEDLSEFKLHLHPELVEYLETKEGAQAISLLSNMGSLKTIEESKWVSSKSAASTAKGQYEFSNYEVQATFENGKGVVKVSTIPNGDGYYVTNFQIFSNHFATLMSSN
ncbi:hypothetical protein MD535_13805 [Vibrio sp. ZSDZ65]|uniref:Uncharacterized protein n=1 Tax=Vibrio qingdaonensis TaxID=2829491 RepID=A0A9X3HWV7_9VIBR|nr:hypothetical protein [Vibrio qingdaonensis]MCW8347075.1 hypothetical protein [Vibrio qingdaonensis]